MTGIINYILSPDFANAILRMSTPLLFVAMAAIISSKAGIFCIAFEGIMLFAALGGVLGSAFSQNLYVGFLSGIASGLFMALVFAYFVLKLNTEPMLIGLALNILGSDGTIYCLFVVSGSKSHSISLPSLVFPSIQITLIKSIPIIGQIFSGHNIFTYLAFITVIIVQCFIYKTSLGLRILAVGEASDVAQSVGINVIKTKFTAMMISGVLASLGGIYMTMGYLPYFTRDMISGRGFIGIAAQCLGKSNPFFTLLWTLVFGGAEAIGNIFQSYRMPSQFASMLPYLVTLMGLVLMNINKKKDR